MLSTDLDSTFYALFVLNILAAILTGGTWQWVVNHGGLSRQHQYNTIVSIAALSSLIQTVTCFINALTHPVHSMGFMIFILINWVVMTHSSVLLVSKKLALTYINADQVWHRLLMINVCMLPFSLFTCVYWTVAYNVESDIFPKINAIMEPIQITLWGIIEFCLSGAFILQMWKFQWTEVERQAIYVLILVGCCDCMSVLANLFVGDLQSTCVKGFVYCLRIRLEVGVLCQMVDFVKSKRGNVTFGASTASRPFSKGSEASAPQRWFSQTSQKSTALLSHSHEGEALSQPFALVGVDNHHHGAEVDVDVDMVSTRSVVQTEDCSLEKESRITSSSDKQELDEELGQDAQDSSSHKPLSAEEALQDVPLERAPHQEESEDIETATTTGGAVSLHDSAATPKHFWDEEEDEQDLSVAPFRKYNLAAPHKPPQPVDKTAYEELDYTV